MTFLLPLVALALAVAMPFVQGAERGRIDLLRLGVLVLLTLGGAVLIQRSAPEVDRLAAQLALVLGAAICVLGRWTGSLAAGVAGASALHLLPATTLPAAGLALVGGTGLGALAVGGEVAALAAVLVVAADNLGLRHSQVPAAAFVGSEVGLAVTVGAFLAALLPKGVAALRPILVGIAAILAGLFVARGLNEPSLTLCAAVGALAGVLIHFLMPEEEGESPRVGLAAVVGVALATVAFGVGKGAGMAIAAVASVGILLAQGNRRAALALGPFVGLVLYRVLREAGTGATRALDIAQHYTLLALTLGLILPLMPLDWLRGREGRTAGAAGALLWGVAALAVAPLVVASLGMRGGIGFVVGLVASGLVQALRGGERREDVVSPSSLGALAVGAGLAGATILSLAWLGDEATLSRDQKIRLFAYAGAGIAVIAAILAMLGRTKPQEALK